MASRVFLVRHAKAGNRDAWESDDSERPLTRKGHEQARALAERLTAHTVTELRSSPYRRCVETLEPLAERLATEVTPDERLAEGRSFTEVLELLDELGDGAVLCSHGDVIPDTVDALVRRGLEVRTEPDWRKASVWVIERDADGRFASAEAWPPPVG